MKTPYLQFQCAQHRVLLKEHLRYRHAQHLTSNESEAVGISKVVVLREAFE